MRGGFRFIWSWFVVEAIDCVCIDSGVGGLRLHQGLRSELEG